MLSTKFHCVLSICFLVLNTSTLCANDPAPSFEVHLARSKDGETFTEQAGPVIADARSPAVVNLPNGSLLVLYDRLEEGDGDSTIMASTSSNQGRTWSTPQQVRLDPAEKCKHPRRSALLPTDDGIRMFFIADAPPRPLTKNPAAFNSVEIRSASSRDGIHYKIDERPVGRLAKVIDAELSVAKLGSRTHLYLCTWIRAGKDSDSQLDRRVEHFVSGEGDRFVRVAPIKIDDAIFDGAILPLTKTSLLAFVSADDGIRTMRSRDGSRWKLDDGVRLKQAIDPAIVKTPDGQLMLFSPLAEKTHVADAWTARASAPFVVAAKSNVSSPLDRSASAVSPDAGEIGSELPLQDQPGDVTAANPAILDELWDDDEEVSHDLAPSPTYDQTVDYAQWFLVETAELNQSPAADSYQSFMPDPSDEQAAANWPEFHSMFNDADVPGPPGPWDPTQHPEWETTHNEAGLILEKYREASKLTGPASGYHRDKAKSEADPTEEALLFNIALPALSAHRTLAKAELADAWRMENGRASPTRMIDAWKTVLRAANQLDKGVTLIEDLVATAERNLVELNARWALKDGVFDENNLAEPLRALRRYDVDNTDMGRVVRFEHAAQMDAIQYLFTPPGADGRPQLNPSRLEVLKDLAEDNRDWRAKVAKLTPDDAESTTRAVNLYFAEISAMMRVGYPEIRAVDLDAAQERYLHVSLLTEIMLPNLSRFYVLNARTEASRRATQLAYALHIFKAHEGHWPQSLDDLPVEFGKTMLTDPFTGENFGYRVTPDGPVVYSFGENGLDDGGIHNPRWGDIVPPGESDDFVFWPPQPPPAP